MHFLVSQLLNKIRTPQGEYWFFIFFIMVVPYVIIGTLIIHFFDDPSFHAARIAVYSLYLVMLIWLWVSRPQSGDSPLSELQNKDLNGISS